MITQTYHDIVTPDLLTGAIENNEYDGFLADYHVLHCLIRKYQPTSIFEVGCNMGTGTNIIANAGKAWMIKVYSLDLPTELAHTSLQSTESEGKGDKVGSNCKFAFTLIRADSMQYDFNEFPCDAYFIDGEHDYEHPFRESTEILKQSPKLVIWHDADIPQVERAILDAIYGGTKFDEDYDLYRVTGTRIAYALRKNL